MDKQFYAMGMMLKMYEMMDEIKSDLEKLSKQFSTPTVSGVELLIQKKKMAREAYVRRAQEVAPVMKNQGKVIGKILGNWRRARNLTAEQLREKFVDFPQYTSSSGRKIRSATSISIIRNVENGNNWPNAKFLEQLVSILNIPSESIDKIVRLLPSHVLRDIEDMNIDLYREAGNTAGVIKAPSVESKLKIKLGELSDKLASAL
jgi:transcriptional regulator with XRE-family HTH domain